MYICMYIYVYIYIYIHIYIYIFFHRYVHTYLSIYSVFIYLQKERGSGYDVLHVDHRLGSAAPAAAGAGITATSS